MNPSIIALWYCILGAIMLYAQTNDKLPQRAEKSGLHVTCSCDESTRKVVVLLTNSGKGDLDISYSGPALSYSVKMTAANEKPVTLTELGRDTQLPPRNDGESRTQATSTQTVTIHPREERTEGIPLAYLYTLPAEGGVFKVRVGRKLEHLNEEKHAIETTTLWCNPMVLHLPPIKK